MTANDTPVPAEGATVSGTPAVSVVIPAKDEIGNLPGLIEEIRSALDGTDFEVIPVDDGSSDGTDRMLAELRAASPWLRPVRHARACGQSCAVRTGMLHARGDIVVTIDGDGQNDPAYIPAMVSALNAAGPSVGLCAGQRVGRKATTFKRYASRFANKLRGAILKDNTRDSGCGLKAVRREIFLRLPYFDSWHRFLPALVMREGYGICHVDVVDRERRHGASKYGVFDRALIGALDLFGVWWLRRRRKSLPIVSEIPVNGE
ncbi:glycosyltransferase family 2 protein [Breoghania sp.]|uniref:glycosyltransferase family 2 protein n=1 Tax=Breoghania sp. TaxID=2065378 RepID=UPI002AAAC4B5|nr:glycosyltransferase family 2 protein [Breoghania sp.]